MILLVDYASPSHFESTRTDAALDLAINQRRPVRFHGTVRDHGFHLRLALQALGQVIWSNDVWTPGVLTLDPVITVHPDRIFFEAFSQDQSTYAALLVSPAVFEPHGKVLTGTTNVDFTAWLWGALGEMRTGRKTQFRIGPEGFEVATAGAGGRFERKVDVPDAWVRGFLQVQAAMAMPGTRLEVEPVDLLAAIRYLRFTKARVSPRALRFEFEPGQDAQLVLEPWEHVVPLPGAQHNYGQRKVTRVWGRRRLHLLDGLLTVADSVQIYLKGRGLPSFYAVGMPGMTFVLGLSGFSESSFTGSGGFDLLHEPAAAGDALLGPALEVLRQHYHRSAHDVMAALQVDEPTATRLLVRLCRQGRAMFDVQTRRYRHRELFEVPADEAKYFPPDWRRERAAALLAGGQVHIESCAQQETTKTRRLKTPDGPRQLEITHRDWHVAGHAGDCGEVQVVVGDSGSIIFGRCTCPFFDQNLMTQGPCEHILAVYQKSAELRIDRPTSKVVDMPVSAEDSEDE